MRCARNGKWMKTNERNTRNGMRMCVSVIRYKKHLSAFAHVAHLQFSSKRHSSQSWLHAMFVSWILILILSIKMAWIMNMRKGYAKVEHEMWRDWTLCTFIVVTVEVFICLNAIWYVSYFHLVSDILQSYGHIPWRCCLSTILLRTYTYTYSA